MIFGAKAKIEAIEDDLTIGGVKYNFITIKDVQGKSLPCTVDLCGIVVEFKPIQEVVTKN